MVYSKERLPTLNGKVLLMKKPQVVGQRMSAYTSSSDESLRSFLPGFVTQQIPIHSHTPNPPDPEDAMVNDRVCLCGAKDCAGLSSAFRIVGQRDPRSFYHRLPRRTKRHSKDRAAIDAIRKAYLEALFPIASLRPKLQPRTDYFIAKHHFHPTLVLNFPRLPYTLPEDVLNEHRVNTLYMETLGSILSEPHPCLDSFMIVPNYSREEARKDLQSLLQEEERSRLYRSRLRQRSESPAPIMPRLLGKTSKRRNSLNKIFVSRNDDDYSKYDDDDPTETTCSSTTGSWNESIHERPMADIDLCYEQSQRIALPPAPLKRTNSEDDDEDAPDILALTRPPVSAQSRRSYSSPPRPLRPTAAAAAAAATTTITKASSRRPSSSLSTHRKRTIPNAIATPRPVTPPVKLERGRRGVSKSRTAKQIQEGDKRHRHRKTGMAALAAEMEPPRPNTPASLDLRPEEIATHVKICRIKTIPERTARKRSVWKHLIAWSDALERRPNTGIFCVANLSSDDDDDTDEYDDDTSQEEEEEKKEETYSRDTHITEKMESGVPKVSSSDLLSTLVEIADRDTDIADMMTMRSAVSPGVPTVTPEKPVDSDEDEDGENIQVSNTLPFSPSLGTWDTVRKNNASPTLRAVQPPTRSSNWLPPYFEQPRRITPSPPLPSNTMSRSQRSSSLPPVRSPKNDKPVSGFAKNTSRARDVSPQNRTRSRSVVSIRPSVRGRNIRSKIEQLFNSTTSTSPPAKEELAPGQRETSERPTQHMRSSASATEKPPVSRTMRLPESEISEVPEENPFSIETARMRKVSEHSMDSSAGSNTENSELSEPLLEIVSESDTSVQSEMTEPLLELMTETESDTSDSDTDSGPSSVSSGILYKSSSSLSGRPTATSSNIPSGTMVTVLETSHLGGLLGEDDDDSDHEEKWDRANNKTGNKAATARKKVATANTATKISHNNLHQNSSKSRPPLPDRISFGMGEQCRKSSMQSQSDADSDSAFLRMQRSSSQDENDSRIGSMVEGIWEKVEGNSNAVDALANLLEDFDDPCHEIEVVNVEPVGSESKTSDVSSSGSSPERSEKDEASDQGSLEDVKDAHWNLSDLAYDDCNPVSSEHGTERKVNSDSFEATTLEDRSTGSLEIRVNASDSATEDALCIENNETTSEEVTSETHVLYQDADSPPHPEALASSQELSTFEQEGDPVQHNEVSVSSQQETHTLEIMFNPGQQDEASVSSLREIDILENKKDPFQQNEVSVSSLCETDALEIVVVPDQQGEASVSSLRETDALENERDPVEQDEASVSSLRETDALEVVVDPNQHDEASVSSLRETDALENERNPVQQDEVSASSSHETDALENEKDSAQHFETSIPSTHEIDISEKEVDTAQQPETSPSPEESDDVGKGVGPANHPEANVNGSEKEISKTVLEEQDNVASASHSTDNVDNRECKNIVFDEATEKGLQATSPMGSCSVRSSTSCNTQEFDKSESTRGLTGSFSGDDGSDYDLVVYTEDNQSHSQNDTLTAEDAEGSHAINTLSSPEEQEEFAHLEMLMVEEDERHEWFVLMQNTLEAEFKAFSQILATMKHETDQVERLMEYSHKGILVYAKALGELCDDPVFDPEDARDPNDILMKALLTSYRAISGHFKESLPGLKECVEEMTMYKQELSASICRIQDRCLGILKDLSSSEDSVRKSWGECVVRSGAFLAFFL